MTSYQYCALAASGGSTAPSRTSTSGGGCGVLNPWKGSGGAVDRESEPRGLAERTRDQRQPCSAERGLKEGRGSPGSEAGWERPASSRGKQRSHALLKPRECGGTSLGLPGGPNPPHKWTRAFSARSAEAVNVSRGAGAGKFILIWSHKLLFDFWITLGFSGQT